jgi:hypothetical protein
MTASSGALGMPFGDHSDAVCQSTNVVGELCVTNVYVVACAKGAPTAANMIAVQTNWRKEE